MSPSWKSIKDLMAQLETLLEVVRMNERGE